MATWEPIWTKERVKSQNFIQTVEEEKLTFDGLGGYKARAAGSHLAVTTELV